MFHGSGWTAALPKRLKASSLSTDGSVTSLVVEHKGEDGSRIIQAPMKFKVSVTRLQIWTL